MMIISFAWTTSAFLAGRKTRTRRDWLEDYAKRFHVGDLVQAWDRVPRVRDAKRVGTIRITGIKKEPISAMPDEDFEKEGFAYMEEQGIKMWGMNARESFENWRSKEREYYVVDFEKVEP
jgi:hypothetical protein